MKIIILEGSLSKVSVEGILYQLLILSLLRFLILLKGLSGVLLPIIEYKTVIDQLEVYSKHLILGNSYTEPKA